MKKIIDEKKDSRALVPYSSIGKELLNSVYEALYIYHKFRVANPTKPRNLDLINGCFSNFLKFEENKIRSLNRHLKLGKYTGDSRKGIIPRLSALVANSYDDLMKSTKRLNGYAMPSPLNILYNALTIPEEPNSSAYSLSFCRTILFEKYKVFPRQTEKIEEYKFFDIRDIQDSLSTFNSWIFDDNNIPKKNQPDKTQLLIAQFLAMKGIFFLRFDNDINVKKFFESKDIDGDKNDNKLFEFRLNEKFSELPDEGEIYNELSGIPIPIRGLETIFHGGLRKDSDSSLVIRVSGTPGVGKTSFALSLAATLSPFNTQTYYMSLEEQPNDLRNRLHSLIPEYLKRLSIFEKDVDDWFFPEKITLEKDNKIQDFILRYLVKIDEKIKFDKIQMIQNNLLPNSCPLLIVIDSIRGLIKEDFQQIEELVTQCRNLNAVVILISNNVDESNRDMDYLVDVVINLNQEGITNHNEKPIRTFQLVKTRHQLSRPGTHLFHLSGEHKFRVSPQIPSLLDKKDKIKRPIPSETIYIDTFYNQSTHSGVKIFTGSQVLLHGHGSSGKAGLALKILLSKPKSENKDEIGNIPRRKILIVSFLYEELYYKELFRRFINQNSNEYKGLHITKKPKMHTLCFFAGFLSPEDMVNKIVRLIEASFYEGEPYTGVLIDGLHNVSLQFRNMKDIDLIYPALYNILVKYQVTVVTTFTNFVLNVDDATNQKDQEILLEGHKPLLHAIVKPTDYYFLIEAPTDEEVFDYSILYNNFNQKQKDQIKIDSLEGEHIVSVKSAIRYNFKGSNKFLWNRETRKLVFSEDIFPKDIAYKDIKLITSKEKEKEELLSPNIVSKLLASKTYLPLIRNKGFK